MYKDYTLRILYDGQDSVNAPPPGRRAAFAPEADLQKPRDAGMLV